MDTIQITEQGLWVPRQFFQDLGEIEIVQGKDYILIKPRHMTIHFKGFVHSRLTIAELHQDYELTLLEGAPA